MRTSQIIAISTLVTAISAAPIQSETSSVAGTSVITERAVTLSLNDQLTADTASEVTTASTVTTATTAHSDAATADTKASSALVAAKNSATTPDATTAGLLTISNAAAITAANDVLILAYAKGLAQPFNDAVTTANSAVLAGESSTAKTSLSQAILAAANNLVTEAPNPDSYQLGFISGQIHDRQKILQDPTTNAGSHTQAISDLKIICLSAEDQIQAAKNNYYASAYTIIQDRDWVVAYRAYQQAVETDFNASPEGLAAALALATANAVGPNAAVSAAASAFATSTSAAATAYNNWTAASLISTPLDNTVASDVTAKATADALVASTSNTLALATTADNTAQALVVSDQGIISALSAQQQAEANAAAIALAATIPAKATAADLAAFNALAITNGDYTTLNAANIALNKDTMAYNKLVKPADKALDAFNLATLNSGNAVTVAGNTAKAVIADKSLVDSANTAYGISSAAYTTAFNAITVANQKQTKPAAEILSKTAKNDLKTLTDATTKWKLAQKVEVLAQAKVTSTAATLLAATQPNLDAIAAAKTASDLVAADTSARDTALTAYTAAKAISDPLVALQKTADQNLVQFTKDNIAAAKVAAQNAKNQAAADARAARVHH